MNRLFAILLLFFLSTPANAQTIWEPKATVGVTFVRIFWFTDSQANSRVDYGTTTAYGSNDTDASSVYWHYLTITGLSANTTYHFKVTSGSKESGDYTFTTYANPTGTVHTVGSGKDYTTISSCASAASAGWTCLVYSGDYNETVSVPSGTSGNRITFLAQEPCTVNAFNGANADYWNVKGFELDGSTAFTVTGATYFLIDNNYAGTSTNRMVYGQIGASPGVEAYKIFYGVISNNVEIGQDIADTSGGAEAFYYWGENNLLDNNLIVHQNQDHFYGGGSNNVFRNNVFLKNESGQDDAHHVDMFQTSGLTSNYSLYENNKCLIMTGSDRHFVLFRDQAAPACENLILRYNYNYQVSSYNIGGPGDSAPYARIYNNTLYNYDSMTNWGIVFAGSSGNGRVFNNIFYETVNDGYYPYYGSSGGDGGYNMAYNVGYSGSWSGSYTSESTYSAYRNQDPGLSNLPYTTELAGDAFAIDKGGPLTTVSSGCGTSTLTLADARWFQPGWAGTEADWIAIGTVTNVYQISDITDYAAGTVIFDSAVSCTNGANVWLYKKSDGTRVLYGSAPDIGASETIGLSAPEHLTIISVD